MSETKHTMQELYQWQSLPLEVKIMMTKDRIRGWVNEWGEDGVYISFSGGKDSTVLLDIARQEYPNIPAMFVDVPTQYPELREFAKRFDNVEIVKPKLSFIQVCEKYGFPLISKEVSRSIFEVSREAETQHIDKRDTHLWHYYFDKNSEHSKKYPGYSQEKYDFLNDAPFVLSHSCCNVMKKNPAHSYAKRTGRKAITAQMASESRLRATEWLKNGCNGFDMKIPISNPMAFWTEQDVLLYIKIHNLPICSVYGDIVTDWSSTDDIDGQMTISDIEEWGNTELFDAKRPLLKTTGCDRTGCVLCGFGCHLEKPGEGRFERLKVTHPGLYRLMDAVKNNGVTYREAIEWINEHGDMDIKL